MYLTGPFQSGKEVTIASISFHGEADSMAKLGSKKRPIVGHVRTSERAEEVMSVCIDRGWQAVIGIEPDMPEDLSQLNRLLYPPEPKKAGPSVGRNDPCPCGSGKKYKKCCMVEP